MENIREHVLSRDYEREHVLLCRSLLEEFGALEILLATNLVDTILIIDLWVDRKGGVSLLQLVQSDRRGRMATSPRRLVGKVAVITASTQGIGFSIAERLGLEGASVVISSRKQKNVDEAVAKLKSKGIETFGLECHVSSADHRKRLMESAVERYGAIDILVSNAAVNPSIDPIMLMSEKALDKLWEVNLKASVQVVQAAGPHLSGNSSVIFISSITAYSPPSSLAMYGVMKTALLGLTKALANELAPQTRVNAIAPGFVPTHFADFLVQSAAAREELESQTLLKRLGTVGDMGATAAFLASDDSAYITGETIVVAGGLKSRL